MSQPILLLSKYSLLFLFQKERIPLYVAQIVIKPVVKIKIVRQLYFNEENKCFIRRSASVHAVCYHHLSTHHLNLFSVQSVTLLEEQKKKWLNIFLRKYYICERRRLAGFIHFLFRKLSVFQALFEVFFMSQSSIQQ